MAFVALGHFGQERASGFLDLGAVERQRPGAADIVAKAADRRARGHDGAQLAAIHLDLPGVGVLAVGPIGRRVNQFGDDGLDAVLGRQIHLPVVVRPVIVARPAFDGTPHEPVTEGVQAVLSGNAIVAVPVLLGRVRLAEIHRPKGYLRNLVRCHLSNSQGNAYPWRLATRVVFGCWCWLARRDLPHGALRGREPHHTASRARCSMRFSRGSACGTAEIKRLV